MTARYALHDGGWVSCILGAPEWVNAEFRELFAEGVPSIAPLVVRSEGPPEANCLSLAGSSAARVAQTQPVGQSSNRPFRTAQTTISCFVATPSLF